MFVRHCLRWQVFAQRTRSNCRSSTRCIQCCRVPGAPRVTTSRESLRLRGCDFPEEGTSKLRLQAFGKSLVEFVNRTDPEKSLLLLKPTLRIAHTGGERIRKTSAEEKILRGWISQLAAMPAAEVASALEYRKREAAGHGEVPTVVLRRLTHAQYDNTVRDLLKDTTGPASRFPPGGLRQRLQESIRCPFCFALADASLRPRGGAVGGARVPSRRFTRIDSMQTRQRRWMPAAAASLCRLSAGRHSDGRSRARN